MRKFITNTIYIAIPIILAFILMEILLRNIPNDYSFKKEYLDKNSNEIETLILGSSHTYYGVDPSYFSSNTFNASHVSQYPNHDFEILKKYQSNFKNLKTVILPISYFTYATRLKDGKEAWRIKNYMIYYDLNISKSLSDNSEVFGNKTSTNIKRIASSYILNKSVITSSNLGWGTIYNATKQKDLEETGKKAALRHTQKESNTDKSKQIINKNKSNVEAIVKWCEERNIKIILITTPTYKTYHENLNSEQLNLMINTNNEIATKYENCTYLNLLSDSNFIAKDYYDADHLSEIGAKKLSLMLDQAIINLK
ncbi:hypothetical protein [Lacinutrix undariae]